MAARVLAAGEPVWGWRRVAGFLDLFPICSILLRASGFLIIPHAPFALMPLSPSCLSPPFALMPFAPTC